MSDQPVHYSSFIVDSHITENHDSCLSRLDAAKFIGTVKRTGVDSFMVFACCHNGNCYYPTRVGTMHRNLNGRDFFGESVSLLRKAGISPRAYYTVVYHRRSARANPDWRVLQVDGTQNHRRSWHCCPNSRGHRDFAKAQLQEIAAYDIDSIFVDMTFWPGICICHNCRTRFLKEFGRDIPTTVDWHNAQWVQFQRAREQWLSEFGHELTDAIKAVNPKIAVAHQFSPVLLGWMYGQSHALSLASDRPSGDFYGGRDQQRIGTKVLAAFERSLPFEFMTSRCVTLYDHTSSKSDAELFCSCVTTLANGGTYILIDVLNPDGTLESAFYDRAEELGKRLRPFAERLKQLKPRIQADTALYFSMASNVRRDHNDMSTRDIMNPANNMLAVSDLKPVQELIGTSIVLNRCKIPYRVLTDHSTDFNGLKSIIINDAAYMSAEETARIRQFVQKGGTLIATGLTSLYDQDGQSSGDFALKDVFGVSYTGKFSKHWNYVVPAEGEMISNDVPGPLVNATTALVLARVAEPLYDRDDLEHFMAYHSNPPGPPGPHAALTVHHFGRGTCVYLHSSLLAKQQESQQLFGASIFQKFAPSSILLSCDAPESVEVTLLRGTRAGTYLLCLVNYQHTLPNIPIHDIHLVVRLPCGGTASRCRSVATNHAVEFDREVDALRVTIPRLETVEMIEIEMKEN